MPKNFGLRLLLVVLLTAVARNGFTQPATPIRWMENRVVVALQPELLSQAGPAELPFPELRTAFARLGVTAIRQKFPNSQLPAPGDPRQVNLRTLYTIDYANPVPVERAIRALKKYKHLFRYVEPHYIDYPMAYTPAEYDSSSQWFAWRIQALEAWDLTKGDTSVVIGIIDTGTQWDHPDLIGNMAYNHDDPIDGIDNDNDGYVDNYTGWDFAGDTSAFGTTDGDNDPIPPTGSNFLDHGTGVTSYLGATTDNGIGTVNPGFNCRFLPVKASADNFPGGSASILHGYDGIVYCADQGAQIINCSWGGYQFSLQAKDIIDYATFNQNALVVAAAGNSNEQADLYPASYPNVLSVSAVTSNLSMGNSTRSCKIDITAPGSGLRATYGDNYGNSGIVYSSYASPVAAGGAGLVRSYYPNLTAQQLGERIRVTSDAGIYQVGANSNQINLKGKGLLALNNALVVNSPAVRLENINVQDGVNDIIETGDTMELLVEVRNYLQATSGLSVSLSTEDTAWIEVISPTSTYGMVPTLGTKTNLSAPLRFRVKPGAPPDQEVDFTLEYTDGLYSDYECFSLVINPTFVNVNTASLSTTWNAVGNFGFNDFPSNDQGRGFLYNDFQTLFEGGYVVGRGDSLVAHNLRDSLGSQNSAQDFVPVQNISATLPGNLADTEVRASFSDANAPNPPGVEVTHEVFGWDAAPDDKFLLVRVVLKNTEVLPLNNLYTGFFADWDLGDPGNDNTGYDPQQRMAYAYGDDEQGQDRHTGIVLLSEDVDPHAWGSTVLGYAWTDSAHYRAISSGTDSAEVLNNDIIQHMGAGPLQLFPTQTDTLYFAFVAGNDFQDLQAAAQAARQKYLCSFIAEPLQPEISGAETGCDSLQLEALPFGAASYLWSNGATTREISVENSGQYSVTVTNALGCSFTANKVVAVQSGFAAQASISDTLVQQNALGIAQVSFRDSTPGVTERLWDFGNGSTSTDSVITVAYGQPGTYTVTLIVSDGVCSDTLTREITVTEFVGRPEAGSLPGGMEVFPNPAGAFVQLRFAQLPPGQSTLRLLAADGREVLRAPLQTLEQPAAATYKLPLANFSKGLYLLRVQTPEGTATEPLLIE